MEKENAFKHQTTLRGVVKMHFWIKRCPIVKWCTWQRLFCKGHIIVTKSKYCKS